MTDKPALTQTMINLLVTQSPLHAWTANRHLNPDYQPEFSKEMDRGQIVHALLLQGESIATVLDFDDYRTKDARAARDEARQAGRYPILAKDWPMLQAMVEQARIQVAKHRDAKDAFNGGWPEWPIQWMEDGIHCKARLDYLSGDHKRIFDYKTTGGSAHPETISRSLFDRGYDIQGCWYSRAVEQVYQVQPEFFLITQEIYAPFALSVVGLTPEAKWYGQKRCEEGMRLWKECLASGVWPGYLNETAWAQLPQYLERAWLAKEMEDINVI